MVNQDSINKTKSFWEGLVKPVYESYSFSNINEACRGLLLNTKHSLPLNVLSDSTVKKYKKIILIVADGLGWQLLNKSNSGILDKLLSINGGKLSRLTSLFPSSTTPSLIKLHSNRNVLETGIIDWTYYESSIDQVICPILNSSAKQAFGQSRMSDFLLEMKVDISKILPPHDVYTQLIKSNINVKHYFPANIYNSNFSKWSTNYLMKGYTHLEEAFEEIINENSSNEKRSLTSLYLSSIDSLSHTTGPFSLDTFSATNEFLQEFLKFIQNAQSSLSDTLILMTADHGQMPIQNSIFLDESFPELADNLEVDITGEPILPCGSPRALFLNVASQHFDKTTSFLNEKLAKFAKIIPLESLLKNNIFGRGLPSQSFLNNTGKICLLPFKGFGIFWSGQGLYDENLKGAHGGLSKEEIYIPLFTVQI